MKTVAFCEIDPYCRAVLSKHWPDIPIHDDVRTLNARQYGADLICGGYPCQPFSTAGKRRGAEDDRHLWPEMFRIIKECRPAWILCENVAGHVNLGLDDVLSDLESEGYACQPFIIPALAVDAKHRRDRVWIVANASIRRCDRSASGKVQQPRRAEAIRTSETLADAQSQRFRETGADSKQLKKRIARSSALPNTESSRRSKGDQNTGRRRERKTAQKKWSGLTDLRWWPPEPDVGRVAYGVSAWLDGFVTRDEALRILQHTHDPAALEEWQSGRNISKAEVLQQSLLRIVAGSTEPHTLEGCVEEASTTKIQSRQVQSLSRDDEIAEAPQGQRSFEQLKREHRDPLPNLSHQGTHDGFELGCLWSQGQIPRVARNVENRVSRLRALGNAVVPQIPEIIGRAIIEAEQKYDHSSSGS